MSSFIPVYAPEKSQVNCPFTHSRGHTLLPMIYTGMKIVTASAKCHTLTYTFFSTRWRIVHQTLMASKTMRPTNNTLMGQITSAYLRPVFKPSGSVIINEITNTFQRNTVKLPSRSLYNFVPVRRGVRYKIAPAYTIESQPKMARLTCSGRMRPKLINGRNHTGSSSCTGGAYSRIAMNSPRNTGAISQNTAHNRKRRVELPGSSLKMEEKTFVIGKRDYS